MFYAILQRFYIGRPVARWTSGWMVHEGSRESLIADIRSGQIEGVQKIMEVVEGEIAQDITSDIVIEMAQAIDASETQRRDIIDLIEEHGGLAFAHGLRAIERTFSAE